MTIKKLEFWHLLITDLENANDVAFQMVGSYLDLIRSYKLLQNAKDSSNITEKIYKDVQELFDAGLTTKSEVTKIFAALSLARSNLVVQENNLKEKEFRFKRLFGRDVNIAELELPMLEYAMPESIQRATMLAIENNPSILVSNYNIQGAQSLYKERQSSFYPKVDLALEQTYNGADPREGNAYERGVDDRSKAYVTLSWNLYRGGADVAEIQKTKSRIHREVETQRDLKRQVIEGLELSWTAYEMISTQLKELYQYNIHSADTLDSYQSEYEMGRRTLLDLLSAQNDLISSRTQIINAEFDKLYAQYRILDATGMLVSTLAGDTQEYENLIKPTTQPFAVVKDTLPINLDVDGDGIVDSLDICDNSISNDDIKPYGCSQKELDSDHDGIPDNIDKCPNTVFGAKVDQNGCEIEGENNKFQFNQEVFVQKVQEYTDNSPIKDSSAGLYDYNYSPIAANNTPSTKMDNHLMYDQFKVIKRYDEVSVQGFKKEGLSQNSQEQIAKIAQHIQSFNDDKVVVTVIGHTKKLKNIETSQQTAIDYANAVAKVLQDNGVSSDIMIVEGRADKDRGYLATLLNEEPLNDRVMISAYVPKTMEEIVEETKQKEAPVTLAPDTDNDGVIDSSDQCLDTPEGVLVDANGCPITINLKVLFATNSAAINPESMEETLKFGEFLLENPEYNTVITGHASKDRLASDSYNKQLSLRRAQSVKDALIKEGIDESRITVIGKGVEQPVATNYTKEGRAQNQRIEAIIIDTTKNSNTAN